MILLLATLAFPARAQPPARWTLEQQFRLGGAHGPVEFTDLRSVAITRTGTIVVLDAAVPALHFFDAGGRLLRSVGRRGAGPGEFQRPNGVLAAPDGRLLVNDPPRISVLSDSGTPVRVITPAPRSYGYLWQARVDRHGRLIENDVVRRGSEWVPAFVRGAPDAARRDTLLPTPCGPASRQRAWSFPRGSMQVPFASFPHMAVDARGGIWCAHGASTELTYTPWGAPAPAATIRTSPAPVPVTAAERDSAIAAVQAFMKRAGEAPVDWSQIPATKPNLETLAVDDRDRLWVQRPPARGRTVYEVFEGNRQVATLAAPFRAADFLPPTVHGDRLYAVVLDADDVPVLVVARVRR